MAKRSQPRTLGARVDDRVLARVDAAARLRGLSRSEYVRAVMAAESERDLRAEVAETQSEAQS